METSSGSTGAAGGDRPRADALCSHLGDLVQALEASSPESVRPDEAGSPLDNRPPSAADDWRRWDGGGTLRCRGKPAAEYETSTVAAGSDTDGRLPPPPPSSSANGNSGKPMAHAGGGHAASQQQQQQRCRKMHSRRARTSAAKSASSNEGNVRATANVDGLDMATLALSPNSLARHLRAGDAVPHRVGVCGKPCESDSFTDNLVVGGAGGAGAASSASMTYPRRKRLVKKMAVDASCMGAGDVDPTGSDMEIESQQHQQRRQSYPSGSGGSGRRAVTADGRLSRQTSTSKSTVRSGGGGCAMDSSAGSGSQHSCNMEHDLRPSDDSDVESAHSGGGPPSDAGADGDDEQSDWFLEKTCSARPISDQLAAGGGASSANDPNECMGVPDIRRAAPATRLLQCGGAPLPSVVESSDTDISQTSVGAALSQEAGPSGAATLGTVGGRVRCITLGHKRWLAKASSSSGTLAALNRKLMRFVRDAGAGELRVTHARPSDRRHALALAQLHSLAVRVEFGRRRDVLVLTKI